MAGANMKLHSLLAGGVACMAIFGFSSSASAALVVNTVGLVDNYTATVHGENVYMSPLVFNGVLNVFCVDPYHNIWLGNQDYTFNPASLSTNSDGALTGTGTPLGPLAGEIGALVGLGMGDIGHGDLLGASAAQGAIWQLEGSSVTPYGADASALATRMAFDLTWAGTHSHLVSAIYDQTDNVQGFAAVPEPGVWAMLMMGFGALGMAMRSARGRRTLATSR
jgi:hypothetical protein